MEVWQIFRNKTANSRDILHYMTVRDADEHDDEELGAFLLKVFSIAGCVNTPDRPLQAGRVTELLNVRGRRRDGVVRVLELGNRIIGTYSVIRPGTILSGAWNENSAYFCSFALDHSMQGLGLAAILMLEAQIMVGSWGCTSMDLKVVASADPLHRLYERLSYRRDPKGDCHEHGFDLLGYTAEVSPSKTNDILRAI